MPQLLIKDNRILTKNGGVYTNTVAPAPVFSNQYSLNFDGTDEEAAVITGSSFASFDKTDPFSVSMWAKFDTVNNFVHLFSKSTGLNGNDGYMVYMNSGVLIFQLGNGATYWQRYFNYQPPTTAWVHVILVFSGTGYQSSMLYVNNVIKPPPNAGTGTGEPGDIINTGIFRLGRRGNYTGNNTFLNGKEDEVTIWNKALDADERSLLWNDGNPTFPSVVPSYSSNCICYLRFDDAVYDNPYSGEWYIPDQTGNGNHFRTYNMESNEIVANVPENL